MRSDPPRTAKNRPAAPQSGRMPLWSEQVRGREAAPTLMLTCRANNQQPATSNRPAKRRPYRMAMGRAGDPVAPLKRIGV